MDGRLPTPPHVQQLLGNAMIDLGNAWRDAGSRLAASDPPLESEAAQVEEDTVGSSFLGPVSMSLSAASDEFQAVARLVRMDETFGPSIAALTRTTLETLGRAWWVLSATDLARSRHRAALMYLNEVKSAQRYTPTHIRATLHDGRAEAVDAEPAVEEAQRDFDAVKVPGGEDKVPTYTALVTGVMEAADVDEARAEYSHLSGVAHGEVFTVGGFSRQVSPDQPDVGSLQLPNSNLFQYIWTLTHVVDLCLLRWFELWQSTAERERWEQRRDRAYGTFEHLRLRVYHWNPETQDYGDWDPDRPPHAADCTTAFGRPIRRG
ncbi:hypothetical protein [Plantibacter sp. ME-Dv--P-095]|uniref:hypothetical protein n=1 Tax=Plantibacter sp. ME-Dv--P-095 TaxID=3040299 RepID=UPI00254F89E7|nr:hypothetical protein [Plantibacter sp. ME-Dv--P-095]